MKNVYCKLKMANGEFVIAVPCHYPIDLFERLWAVDTVDRSPFQRGDQGRTGLCLF